MGLKTTYYLRTLAASSIEKSTVDLVASREPIVEAKSISEPPPALAEPTVVEIQPTQSLASATAIETVESSEGGPKLCLINDPDCEACQ